MIRFLLVTYSISLLSFFGIGQQLFNYTHNLILPGIQNPSFTAYKQELNFGLIRKSSFSSFEGAPIDNSFYFSSPLSKSSGIGAFINQNTQGIFKEINADIQYAKSFQLSTNFKLGLGASAGIKNQVISTNNIIAFDNNDPFLISGNNNNTIFDASFGVFLSSSRFLFRTSVPQLLGSKYSNGFERLKQHIFSDVQYKFILPNNFILTATAGASFAVNAPANFNVGALIYYKTLFWFGAIYKPGYAISPMAGIRYKDVSIGYSYDYAQMNLANLGLNHEIMIRVRIRKNKNTEGNFFSQAAEDKIVELIDEYFDVQNSDLPLMKKVALMRKIKKDIESLIPFIEKEVQKAIKEKFNNPPPKPTVVKPKT